VRNRISDVPSDVAIRPFVTAFCQFTPPARDTTRVASCRGGDELAISWLVDIAVYYLAHPTCLSGQLYVLLLFSLYF